MKIVIPERLETKEVSSPNAPALPERISKQLYRKEEPNHNPAVIQR